MKVFEVLDICRKNILENNLEISAANIAMAHVLRIKPGNISLKYYDDINEEQTKYFNEIMDEYINDKKPLQYILGYEYFLGEKYYVDENVLIPRPETEEVVEVAKKIILEKWNKNDLLKICDIGVGSGIISISIKKWLNENGYKSEIYAVDISNNAIEIAKKNAKANNVEINFLQGDYLNPIIENNIQIDVLLSNPPYISRDFNLDEMVKKEPEIALYENNDGLLGYEKMIKNIPKILSNNSVAVFEIGYNQGEDLKNMAEEILDNVDVNIQKDINKNDRIMIIKV